MNNKKYFYLKNIKIYKMNSMFIKLFISYIVIIFLIVLTSVFAYNYLKDIWIKKEIKTNENYLNYHGKVIDQEFANINKAIFSFLNSNDNKERFKRLDKLINQYYIIGQLNQFKYSNPLIDTCMLYSKDIPCVLNNEGSLSKEYMFKEYFKFENKRQEEILKLIETNSSFKYFSTQKVFLNNKLIDKSFKNYLTIYTGLSFSNSREKFLVLINEEKILCMITDGIITNYGDFYIADAEGNIISSTNKESVTQKIDKKYITKIKENQKQNSFDYKNNLVVYSQSKFANWYYITITPYQQILKNIESMKNMFFYFIFLLIILGIIIAFSASRIYYKPIIQILNSFKEDQFKKEYKNEFAQIISKVNYLQMESEQNEENNLILKAVKTGKIDEKIKNKFNYDEFIAMQIISYKKDYLINYISYLKNNIKENCILKSIYENNYQCVVILNQNNINVEKFIDNLDNIKREHNINIRIGLGNVVDTIYNINVSFEQAVNIIKYGDSSNEKGIYYYKLDLATNNNIYFPIDLEQKLTECIYLGNKSGIEKHIIETFDKNKGIPNSYLNNLLVEFINVYVKLSNKFNHDCNMEEINCFVNEEYSMIAIKKYFCNCFKVLVKDDKIQEDKSKYVGDYVINYIQQNYKNKDLSIDKISEAIQLSTAYVSTLFKKYEGISFSQYLVEYRIEKAKELLENTNEKVKDISGKVGFGTYNNFARTFKKKIGISPNEYRLNTKKDK